MNWMFAVQPWIWHFFIPLPKQGKGARVSDSWSRQDIVRIDGNRLNKDLSDGLHTYHLVNKKIYIAGRRSLHRRQLKSRLGLWKLLHPSPHRARKNQWFYENSLVTYFFSYFARFCGTLLIFKHFQAFHAESSRDLDNIGSDFCQPCNCDE